MNLQLPMPVRPILLVLAAVLCAPSAQALPVSQLQVRIVTGAEEMSAGSTLELRIYEAGRPVRRLSLVHGESWPRDSTHVIPLRLTDALEPRYVQRFALYYRTASPQAPPWEVVAAEVDVPGHQPPERLLNTTLSGVIAPGGELASLERDPSVLTCAFDSDCDDGKACNGVERCAPRSPGADVRGCVKGTPVVCPVNQVCSEGVGCRGLEGPKALTP